MNPNLSVESFNKWAVSEADDKWARTKQRANALGRAPTWLELVEENFAVSDLQVNALKGMSAESSAILQSAAEQVREKGGRMRIEKAGGGKGQLLVEGESIQKSPTQPVGAGIQPARMINIPIAHCTFDADCTNWNCGWGPA